MRAVVQRVSFSSITVDNQLVSSIEEGLNVLLGIEEDDTEKDIEYICQKILHLRIFEDENEKMNHSVIDVQGKVHLISQFTLAGDARKGRRPSFSKAMNPIAAKELFDVLIGKLKDEISVEVGAFGEHMQMKIVNEGPVTILLDSKKKF